MHNYPLYSFDGTGKISMAEWIQAQDDDNAVSKARQMKRQSLKWEVWDHRRLVAVLDARDLTD